MYIIAEIELKTCVLELGLESCDRLLNVVNYVVNACFLSCFGYCVAYRTCKPFCNSFWVIRGTKIGFWMKKS